MRLIENYFNILEKVNDTASKCGREPRDIQVICISKRQPVEKILRLYDAGCRNFGENRVPESLEKQAVSPKDIQWHFVGTLQKNKVSKVVGKFSLIHSVDSFELAQKISDISCREGVVIPLLLQVNTSGELSKHGLSEEAWIRVFEDLQQLSHIEIQGLMTMAPLTENQSLIHQTFSRLRIFKETLLQRIDNKNKFMHLSMGMSHDYAIAVEEGATLLRIGTSIFDDQLSS
ncbi:UPF0001 protein YlmE [Chlamydiales bacterium STE3]|nr:UPF0001 protein YlmE [Chlamydiales bacterium STE3]